MSKRGTIPTHLNAWVKHITAFRRKNPSLTLKECMKKAKSSYKSRSSPYKSKSPKRSIRRRKYGLSKSPRKYGLSKSPRRYGLSKSPRKYGLSKSPRKRIIRKSPVKRRKFTLKSVSPIRTASLFSPIVFTPISPLKTRRRRVGRPRRATTRKTNMYSFLI